MAIYSGIRLNFIVVSLLARDALYQQARQANPKRWLGKTRDWSPIGAVTLNPERECVVAPIDAAAPKISGVAA